MISQPIYFSVKDIRLGMFRLGFVWFDGFVLDGGLGLGGLGQDSEKHICRDVMGKGRHIIYHFKGIFVYRVDW